MIKLALVLAVVACNSTDELDKKVVKLEEDVATLRKERQFLEVKQVQLLKQVTELQTKVDELTKQKLAPPSYARPWLRRLTSCRRSSSECVTTTPPSPVVICLLG